MKVDEKGTDRRAELHIHKHEQVEELAEYGQYIDPDDAAVCCYVPIEDGNIVRVAGRFNGTTLAIHWDLRVDGVLRKANNMISKVVKAQKGVKLDVEEALYLMDDGLSEAKLLETQMKIVPVSGFNFTKNRDSLETVGTIEIRLYVLRTFGAEFPRDTFMTYLDDEDEEEKDDMDRKKATYLTIAPDYMVDFEKNCQELDKKTANAWKKKLNTKRPSKNPWAIFRFHYRSKEAINAQGMKLTHNPKTKGKGTKTHTLELDPVPTLAIGAKPAKPNDGGSTRDDSPTPSRPGTPLKLDSPLPRQFTPRRYTSPPRPFAQRSTAVEDASSEAATAEEQPPGVEQSIEKITNVEDLKDKKEEITNIEAPIEKAMNTGERDSGNEVRPTRPNALHARTNCTNASNLRPHPQNHAPTTTATLKRPASLPLPAGPDHKRTKTLTIAETRRQIKAMKARRETVAKKRADLDSELEPYTAKMREEQERLAKELEEETKMWREESQALRDDAAMLAEMKRVQGGEYEMRGDGGA
ncbi:uncharacterized protein CC84DRAFT_1209377 [Paraphaeosphaeria sporulosa]|uniref:Uncharacterized protein n=1 Tax=Paraphaeosphaeria sporulosa TaxID=1460663 RepID=A0A177C0I8_9PLEO|nr:uncharacterized protein CC84DRAFT_1209377 [Paraphaeosphaeria sporulosa]OAG00409.1 hypothetical protein CC84DRAFT_1209377 [Paraphaeosphaeria sporulosa]